MVKDWTPERKSQLQDFFKLLENTDYLNQTTGALSLALENVGIAKKLRSSNMDTGEKSFVLFLIEELNKG